MRGRVFYGWVVVAVTATVLLATAGIRAAPGAFLVSMQAQPGWTTASLSFAAAVGLISGLATGLVASVLGATVANRWFQERRGFVVGLFGASTSAGQLVFFPLLTTLAVGFGWRAGAVVLA